MDNFEGNLKSNQRSPILCLVPAIAGSSFRIAPEMEGELLSWRDAHSPSIELNDSLGFFFGADSGSKEIITNIASLEFLWCNAHTFYVLYNEYAVAQRRGDRQFYSGATIRSRNAIDLFNWSCQRLVGRCAPDWPTAQPRPEPYPAHGSDIHIANELFLCAVAWILHHEIAHLRLAHQPSFANRSLEQEKEADLEATRWILLKSQAQKESQKRAFGIAVAILAMVGMGDPILNGRETHPKAFQRLDYCLSESGIGDDDEVYAFATCIMQIILSSRGIGFAASGSNFREMFSEYLIAYARWRPCSSDLS